MRSNQDLIRALTHAEHEIMQLRSRVEITEAKVQVMDFFQVTLMSQPAIERVGASWPDPLQFVRELRDELLKSQEKENEGLPRQHP